jgi:hypothetical protein
MEVHQPNFWTRERQELRLWFERNAPSLGELYKGAIEMVFNEIFPGRVRFVSHAVREIRNRLPDVIAGPVSTNQVQYINRLDDLSKVWKKAGLSLDGSLPIKLTNNEQIPPIKEVPIPVKIYKEIAKLIRDHEEARKKPYEEFKRLFQAIDPKNKEAEATLRPRIDNLRKNTEWFVARTHDRGKVDAEMDGDELKKNFEIFERALLAIIGSFYKTLEDLDEILEETNARPG